VRSPAVIVIGDVVRLSPHAAGRSTDAVTFPGESSVDAPPLVTGSADRRPSTADAATKPHWTDALTAGLAVDTGLTRVVESSLTSR
jgi:uroporphyrin-III C-methyltransferase/precorrin-2 dehydrogenase/sirohydrochlorin ferrochelatase/uroporphyrin-III C-methyltransferase